MSCTRRCSATSREQPLLEELWEAPAVRPCQDVLELDDLSSDDEAERNCRGFDHDRQGDQRPVVYPADGFAKHHRDVDDGNEGELWCEVDVGTLEEHRRQDVE